MSGEHLKPMLGEAGTTAAAHGRTNNANARKTKHAASRVDEAALLGAELDLLLEKIDRSLAESEMITRRLAVRYSI